MVITGHSSLGWVRASSVGGPSTPPKWPIGEILTAPDDRFGPDVHTDEGAGTNEVCRWTGGGMGLEMRRMTKTHVPAQNERVRDGCRKTIQNLGAFPRTKGMMRT